MKILVLSDIHANIWALNRILEEEKTYDLLVFAGDMVDYGIAPSEVITKMRSLPDTVLVYGNHDRHLSRVASECPDVSKVPDGLYKWVHYDIERMTSEEISWLDGLPRTRVFEADGWVYLVQHSYIENHYDIIDTRSKYLNHWKEFVPERYWEAPKKRMIFGHTHRQLVYTLDRDMEWINPGSVSYRRPDDPEKNAQYMVIEDGAVRFGHLDYDYSIMKAEALRQAASPRMLETDAQDYMFFFGDAPTGRSPLPGRNTNAAGGSIGVQALLRKVSEE